MTFTENSFTNIRRQCNVRILALTENTREAAPKIGSIADKYNAAHIKKYTDRISCMG